MRGATRPRPLSSEQKKGLKSIKKKVKEGNLVALESDKTGNLGVVDRDRYLEMGRKHTKGDKVLNQVELGGGTQGV